MNLQDIYFYTMQGGYYFKEKVFQYREQFKLGGVLNGIKIAIYDAYQKSFASTKCSNQIC